MAQDEQSVADVLRQDRHRGGWGRAAVFWLLGVVIVVGAVGIWLIGAGSPSTASTEFSTEAVTRGDLKVIVTATGTVEPTNQVDISSELSGMVDKVNVDFNDKVTRGEVLAELDSSSLQAKVASSKANVEVQKANLASAEATRSDAQSAYNRAQSLAQNSVASARDLELAKSTLERAKSTIEVAKANIAVANAALEVDEANLAKARIYSPVDGVVLDRSVEPGQIVAASFQAPTLFSIAEDLTHMQLQVDIDEADIGQVKVGDSAAFTVEAWPDRTFDARIQQVRFAPAEVDGVVTYKAVLSVDNSDLLLRPGMTATADITVNEVKDALLLPNAALRYKPEAAATSRGGGFMGLLRPPRRARTTVTTNGDGGRSVYVLHDGEPVAVTVTTGATDGRQTVVLSGDLKAGDEVITGTRITD